jgi:catechol 2,3-dioxygenase-like lactoylglutathione lyase family enzyme
MALPKPAPSPGDRPARPSGADRPVGMATPPGAPRPVGTARPEGADTTTVALPVIPAGHAMQLQPMVHVDDMPAAVGFYERLGAEVVHGGPADDWVLLQLGTTQIGLLAHPPRAEEGECTVELNFAAATPLDDLERRLRGAGVTIAAFDTHPDFGDQLQVRSPDGLLIKINQLEPDIEI